MVGREKPKKKERQKEKVGCAFANVLSPMKRSRQEKKKRRRRRCPLSAPPRSAFSWRLFFFSVPLSFFFVGRLFFLSTAHWTERRGKSFFFLRPAFFSASLFFVLFVVYSFRILLFVGFFNNIVLFLSAHKLPPATPATSRSQRERERGGKKERPRNTPVRKKKRERPTVPLFPFIIFSISYVFFFFLVCSNSIKHKKGRKRKRKKERERGTNKDK